ncbi:MAG: LacI family DNA-binding transcriptional regulator [Capsulimonadaceae bacterium]|nr:LacI family DNA-binding transcriptional regulator [Capsulimonadaceae bacterium]
MPVSLADIAAVAKVSVGTVSHVLNGNQSAGIAAGTQERVRRIADELGYRPNAFARQLLGKPNKALALITLGVRNPFYTSIAAAVEQAVAALGYRLFTILKPNVYRAREDVGMLPVDGVIAWCPFKANIEHIIGSRIGATPVVYIGYQADDDAEFIGFDLAGGTRLAMAHLVERGYRRIACVIPEIDIARSVPDVRWPAYVACCRDFGVEVEHIPLDYDENRQAVGRKLGEELARRDPGRRPEAVFVTGDNAAIGLYHGALRGGLSIPSDLAIVGFDGIDEGQMLDRPLTSVLCPVDALAKAAASVMVNRLENARESEPRQIRIPSSLIVGETT